MDVLVGTLYYFLYLEARFLLVRIGVAQSMVVEVHFFYLLRTSPVFKFNLR